MKIYDKVKLIKDREEYSKKGLHLEMVGTIIQPEIRDNRFYVAFDNPKIEDDYVFCDIKIQDLELVEDGKATDKMIFEELPSQDKRWWCKVEDGYILNLLGEKKNKEPYKYNS